MLGCANVHAYRKCPGRKKGRSITLYDSDDNPSMLVEPKTPGTWAKKYRVYISNGTNNLPNDPQKLKFKLSVQKEITRNNVPIWVDVEVFDNLEMDSVEDRVNKESIYIKIEVDGWNDGTVVGSGKRPKTVVPIVLLCLPMEMMETVEYYKYPI